MWQQLHGTLIVQVFTNLFCTCLNVGFSNRKFKLFLSQVTCEKLDWKHDILALLIFTTLFNKLIILCDPEQRCIMLAIILYSDILKLYLIKRYIIDVD